MKKLISCLLAVMMLCTAVSAFAASPKAVKKSNVVTQFLDETDLKTKDLALQVQSGDESTDLVLRLDGDNFHMVTREGEKVESHVQVNPTGIYVAGEDSVTLLRYATIITLVQDVVKEVSDVLNKAIESIPEEQIASDEEMKEIVNEVATLATVAIAQEEADAVTLTSAAMAFADKFKPEYILDVKEEDGALQISLRGEAFATALGEAMDELMLNPDLAKLVDRQAALTGGKTFAEAQLDWMNNREATLEAIRTIQSSEMIDENGHWVSHFQIGEESAETKALVCDTDTWLDVENGAFETKICLGFQNENPFMVHEYSANRYQYWEKMTVENSFVEINCEIDNARLTGGKIVCVMEDEDYVRVDFGSDYLYIKGPKGGISTSVRETWTGKIRYELVAENAKGEEKTITVDFYQDDDSLVSELYTNQSDRTVQFKISRIDKVDFEDLSASEKINEITVDDIYNELGNLLKMAIPALTTDTTTNK